MNEVETVYISKTMLHLVGLMKVEADDFDFSGLVRKLESIEIVNAEGDAAKALASKADSGFKGYEKLMAVKDSNDNVDILYKNIDKDHNSFVIVAREPDELSVVVLDGNLTADDVMKAARK
ncbi:MAG: DUF4252 domain-containing protein [Muribaculaceae bacterium]|nr:DUF4252 domain-containing protein [Muribaculaceae bacterium]